MTRFLIAILQRHRWAAVIASPVMLGALWLPVPAIGTGWQGYLDLGALMLAVAGAALLAAVIRRRPYPWRHVPVVFLGGWLCQAFFMAILRWKAWMPHWSPFRWDPALGLADRWLGLGEPVAIRLIPLFGHPLIIRSLDLAYYLWFPIVTGTMLWQLWTPDRERARRFALAFVLTWTVLGVLLAAAFSSVGPVFLERLTGDGRFHALVALSAGQPVGLSRAAMADTLWRMWSRTGYSSISAMPSLHVAMTVLFACVARGRVRALFLVYAVIIFLGSIMLAWHYAVDGYVAALLTLGCWWVAGRLLRVHPPDPIVPHGRDGRGRPLSVSRGVQSMLGARHPARPPRR